MSKSKPQCPECGGHQVYFRRTDKKYVCRSCPATFGVTGPKQKGDSHGQGK
jgi:ribosomal protein S27E